MALNIPNFASETEEADWWYDHRNEVGEDIAEAVVNGTTRTVRQTLLEDHNLVLADTYVEVSLCKEDFELAKAFAAADGISPVQYLARLIHDELEAKQAA